MSRRLRIVAPELGREGLLALFLLLALVAGTGFDLLTDDVGANDVLQEPSIFDERSIYCPPPPIAGDSRSVVTLAAADGRALPVGADDTDLELAAGRTLTTKTEGSTAFVGYGGEIVGTTAVRFTGEVSGLGASRCSKNASTRWYFAEGSSALGAEQRLVIYNPFPDEAVVGISLFTPKGPQGNANLSEGVAVPAGQTTVVELNRFVRQERLVAVSIVAKRGRVIAWRALQLESENRPDGAQFSLGAADSATEWFFPEGAVGEGFGERVTLLNPHEEEAVATVSLATEEGTVQPPKLAEVVVPPKSLVPIALNSSVGGSDRKLGGVGVVVRTSSGELVAERTIYYDTDSVTGTASEVGMTRASSRWFLGPAVNSPEIDSVVLLNPGAQNVSASLQLLGDDSAPRDPDKLQGLTIPAGGRIKIFVDDWTADGAYSVLVEAEGDVVAERFSFEGDEVASVMGIPLVRPSGR